MLQRTIHGGKRRRTDIIQLILFAPFVSFHPIKASSFPCFRTGFRKIRSFDPGSSPGSICSVAGQSPDQARRCQHTVHNRQHLIHLLPYLFHLIIGNKFNIFRTDFRKIDSSINRPCQSSAVRQLIYPHISYKFHSRQYAANHRCIHRQ